MAKLLQTAILFVVVTMAAVEASNVLLGVYYGLEGNNLPTPPSVVQICRKNNIKKIRISEANLEVLDVFGGMGIDISFGISNSDLPNMAKNSSAVEEWFNTYVKPFIGEFTINYIVVGDKVIPELAECILPVMKTLQVFLNSQYLGQVKLTTLMGYNSALTVKNPPSSATFDPTATNSIKEILQYLSLQGSPLMVSLFPYEHYVYNTGNISLSYAQFGGDMVVRDGPLSYTNLFDEMLDAFYSAIDKLEVDGVSIVIGETGWPRCGHGDISTPEIAQNYNQKFIEHISSGKGTPIRPNVYTEGFIKSLFDENLKPAGDSRCYGIFHLNSVHAYPLSLYPKNY